jgi:malonyl-CoA decarboxylase
VDRRCFAFFHPALPHEPLIFIEVALSRGLSGSVQTLLAPDAPSLDPESADAAIFYSITNCQEGLRGVSFGNLLIKQVAQRLGQEFPKIKTFATLSPVPTFRAWLNDNLGRIAAAPEGAGVVETVKRLDDPEWTKQPQSVARLQKALMPLCAWYLLYCTGENHAGDPVARFHLGNGARLERLNWLADTSKRGLQQSAGMMVNYLYRLDQVEDNHEAFVRDHRVVASAELRKLARECVLAKVKGTEERRSDAAGNRRGEGDKLAESRRGEADKAAENRRGEADKVTENRREVDKSDERRAEAAKTAAKPTA